MSRPLETVFGLLFTVLLGVPLIAQTAGPKKSSGEKSTKPSVSAKSGRTERALTPTQQRALQVLDQLFEGAKSFEDDQLKIRVQARIADALWPYDEPRARQQFEAAFRAIDAVKPDRQQGNTSLSPPPLGADALSDETKLELRSEILGLIARHDPRLAERLTKSTVDALPKPNADDRTPVVGNPSEPARPYLQIALSLAKADLQGAAQLVRLSLNSGGIRNPLLPEVLQAIRGTQPALADDLFRDALSVAARDPANLSASISILARYVFPDYGGGMRAGLRSDPGPTEQAGSALRGQFLNFVYQAFIQQPSATQSPLTVNAPPELIETGTAVRSLNTQATFDYLTAQQMLPYFDRFMPDKSAAIRARLDEILNSIPSNEERDSITNLTGPTSTEELLSRAERAQTSLEKDSLYVRAALRAARVGDYDQALSIADKISDERGKSFDVKSIIRYEAASAALKKKDVETAYRYAKDLPNLEERVNILGEIVRLLIDKKEIVRAMEVLNDAEGAISKADNGPDKARALLILSGAGARLDLIRGFEVMRAAVKAINQVEFAAQWEDQPTATGGSSKTKIILGLSMLDFNQGFPLLARGDFDGALLLAQAIEKKEASVLAQLAVCREALNKPADAQNKGKAQGARKESIE